jgi:hypothetical protein
LCSLTAEWFDIYMDESSGLGIICDTLFCQKYQLLLHDNDQKALHWPEIRF